MNTTLQINGLTSHLDAESLIQRLAALPGVHAVHISGKDDTFTVVGDPDAAERARRTVTGSGHEVASTFSQPTWKARWRRDGWLAIPASQY